MKPNRKPNNSSFFPAGNTSKPRSEDKQEVVSITYEEIGLFPRSFSRVLDRFLKQVFSDVENLVIQEYRFYRYLFLTTLKCLLILFFVPFFVNFIAKTYVVRPLTEYFWNTKQTEIFLNAFQQKRAFAELKDFEEKIYFESLIYPKSAFVPSLILEQSNKTEIPNEFQIPSSNPISSTPFNVEDVETVSMKNDEIIEKKMTLNSNLNNQEFVENNKVLTTSTSTAESSTTPNWKLKSSDLTQDNTLTSNKSKKNDDLVKKSIEKKEMETFNEKTESLINSYTLKSSLFVYQTQEADKNIQQRYQEKTIELAQRYNDQSIEAITNFFADLISLITLFYLLYALEIQINITKSFLLEVFFGLDDSKKSLLILLVTDLLVGYHSSNLWELFFEFLFHHYGLPESQTGIFLLVATLPVLLDVLFKYLIFRHLNRSSPATVATYHAMIE